MAQSVEHIIGNDEVPGPIPGSSSKKSRHIVPALFGATTPFGHGFVQMYDQIAKTIYTKPGT